MPKVAFIGAGSMVFAKNLVGDILSFEALKDSTIALMDIDEHRLAQTTEVAEQIVENSQIDATIESTTDRREALDGADYVLNMINVGGTEPFENEIRIPEEYGVKQSIGDTLGPGGIFRGLRTIPTMLDIARDMEELCPNALLMNYTNPMAIVCWAVDEATDIDIVGLCHSVPHTAEAIAEYADIPLEELNYWVAGINHMAWFLECDWDGQDIYPLLEDATDDEETYRKDTVRFELLKHFGAFVTESSHHNSEYLPYFRTDEDLIDELTGTNYAERMSTATYLEGWKKRSEERDDALTGVNPDDVSIERSEEYASRLIHSIETDTPRRLNLNVRNEAGHIQNLENDACIEVPCLVDGTGIRPCSVGELPPQLAALNRTNVNVQRLAVEGALKGDRDVVHQAVKLDPLTAAELDLDEIHEMTEELIAANKAYLPALD
ncbi:glycoside hydrolase family 4 (plasmid) [Haloterrigena turkmenica DSM 5511]|uniref:Glycoside hydrolase family 4 n=1 Tax=Haloterrigena turkmenica (strain ATCC 51198 / DSM 5511 / JCM 9101 / NCIMB 13204 / VKM B-1734 / 4k) TaxID=543526 RepID=D2S237_HALTV|nr:alpha-glucosidase/alpha-galactosidase [Haloterrigena turkmenica]ADB63434.1 glycoside hydrolase family 4 [Haloterrigena turkmenica DSM 5511]